MSPWLYLFLTLPAITMAARILAVVPTASYSHQVFYQQLWRTLAQRGHQVTVITTDPTHEPLANLTEVSIREAYPAWDTLRRALIDISIFELILTDRFNMMIADYAQAVFNLPQARAVTRDPNAHFDLLMVEWMHPFALAIKHRFRCPLIALSSMDAFPDAHEVMGNPVHSVLYTIQLFPYRNGLTFWQRVEVVVVTWVFEWKRKASLGMLRKEMRELYGEDMPSLEEIMEEVDMLFINANPLFAPARPLSASTVNLAGGMHLKSPKPLPEDLERFMDESTGGVVYFSLGSNILSSEVPNGMIQTIMTVFGDLPYRFLWKFDNTSIAVPANVKVVSWVPQQDILRHKNTRLFITQGGIQSLEEALYTHVPCVIIPFFCDQIANAANVRNQQLGVVLDKDDVTVTKLKAAILEVIHNTEYKAKWTKLALRIQDEPIAPLEKAVWWTDYVLRHGGAQHLKGFRVPTYQYYYIDVLAFLLLLILIFITVVYLMIKILLSKVCGRQRKVKQG